MKTPREILLEHHRAAERRLDGIREQVLARELSRPVANAASANPTLRHVLVRLPARIWQELFWSCHRAWIGLAAAWLVMIAINILSLGEPSARLTTGRAPAKDFWTFLAERQRLLAELGEAAPSPPPQPAATPRPRSEYRAANRAQG
jgi:hypothetical protein